MLSISLPSNIEQQVNQVAKQTGCSVSDFIHEAILIHLKQQEKTPKNHVKGNEYTVNCLNANEQSPYHVMQTALNEFEPDFVMSRDEQSEQVREEIL